MASFDRIKNIQNTWRQKFFEDSDIKLFAQEGSGKNLKENPTQILEKVTSDIQDKKAKGTTTKPIICIDNVPKKGNWFNIPIKTPLHKKIKTKTMMTSNLNPEKSKQYILTI